MESVLPNNLKVILLGLIAFVFVLSQLARVFPDVGWLQVFQLPIIRMSEEERAKRRRSANRMAALEIILAGLALPLIYFISTVMFFNEPKTVPTIIVAVCAIVCIALGLWIYVRNL